MQRYLLLGMRQGTHRSHSSSAYFLIHVASPGTDLGLADRIIMIAPADHILVLFQDYVILLETIVGAMEL